MNLSQKLKPGSHKTAHANSVKSTFRELVTFKLLISICSQMLLFMFLYFILFYFIFLFFLFFLFKSHFKVDLN